METYLKGDCEMGGSFQSWSPDYDSYEELGDGVIIARLVESGNMVLIHPMEENGMTFLP